MIIDSHAHIIDDSVWHDSVLQLGRRNSVESMSDWIRDSSVRGIVLVESSGSVVESMRLLSLARRHSWILGVISALPAMGVEIEANPISRFREDDDAKFLKGFRGPPEFLSIYANSDQRARTRIEMVVEEGLPLDVLVDGSAESLEVVISIARQHTSLRIVLNHCASPPSQMDLEAYAHWVNQIQVLGSLRNVFVKFSIGYQVISRLGGWFPERLESQLAHLRECFSPDRVMLASNWPITSDGIDYPSVLSSLLAGYSSLHVDQVGWRTASDCYVLGFQQ